MSHLVKHIKTHGLESLRQDPYNFKIISDPEHPELITINYHQINTKDCGKNKVIRQARGTIIDVSDENDPKLICYPFSRFYNLGEHKADRVNPATARIVNKEDGSLIKFYFHPKTKQWTPASRGLARVIGDLLEVWKKALNWARDHHQFDESKLDQNHVYLFELVGPDNQIVVQYGENKLYHIGTRCMLTENEIEIDIGIPKPKSYDLNDADDLHQAVQLLVQDFAGRDAEGVIMVDDKYNRVKVKSPSYLLLHHAVGPNVPPDLLCMRAILMNEQDEIRAGRADLAEKIDALYGGFHSLIKKWNQQHQELDPKLTSKEFAKALKTKQNKEDDSDPLTFPHLHFPVKLGKVSSFEQALRDIKDDNKKVRELVKTIRSLDD